MYAVAQMNAADIEAKVLATLGVPSVRENPGLRAASVASLA